MNVNIEEGHYAIPDMCPRCGSNQISSLIKVIKNHYPTVFCINCQSILALSKENLCGGKE